MTDKETAPNEDQKDMLHPWKRMLRPFHMMAKPIGPICNLACEYCFYCEKSHLYPDSEKYRMTDEVLEQFIRMYIESQTMQEINFAWQGGEPTMMGLDFFKRVVELQQQYANGKQISNALQTNGILIDDEWAEFFAKEKFLIGMSIDGPPELHDAYRKNKRGEPTSEKVLSAIQTLKKHGAEFNTLTSVARENSQKPLEVYHYLKDLGVEFMQFIPIIERVPDEEAQALGLDLAAPPNPEDKERYPVTDWSVRPKDFGQFLISIFDEWVENDIGKVFVQQFDCALGAWAGQPGSVCVFAQQCGNAMILEHNGDVYACDHYVYPQYKLGNIMEQELTSMAYCESQTKFGNDKHDALPKYCKECDVLFMCQGECPKHRFMRTSDGETGLSYLCQAYKDFFHHISPYMKMMAQLLRARRAPAEIMQMIADDKKKQAWENVDRNDPCPCGSGKKYKKCCGLKKA